VIQSTVAVWVTAGLKCAIFCFSEREFGWWRGNLAVAPRKCHCW